MIQLPETEWRNHSGILHLVSALDDGKAKPLAVGGAVRDSLLEIPVSDIDLATHLTPNIIIQRLQDAQIKAIPTGIDHGTVTAVSDGRTYEITTFRRDVATDGRRATVAFSDDWREDAQRRDFTINALYADIESGEIFDSVGGLNDLEKRNIRFIGKASERIAEDHLRILRYFRFLARFGQSKIDSEALEACRAAAMSLKSLSRERISSELTRLLLLPDPRLSVELMHKNAIFDAFLPEVIAHPAQQIAALIEREKLYGQVPSLPARLLAILPADPLVIDKLARRLKLSGKLRKALLARLPEESFDAANIRELGYVADIDAARDYALLRQSSDDVGKSIARLESWEKPDFPIKGGKLIKKGLTAGPQVAKTLQAIERQWIEESFPGRDRLDKIVDQRVNAALSDEAT